MGPKVSVIITCYNYGRYVAQAIESVQSQTYKNFEVICVNDGSIDNTASVLKQFERDIIILTLSKNSGGPAYPRNFGFGHSDGDFLVFLDADDTINPQYLEKTIPLMIGNVGVVSTWMEMFEGSTERVGPSASSYPIFAPTFEQILKGNTLHCASLVSRKAFIDVGGYDSSITVGSEDWALWVSIVKAGYEVRVLPEYLFHYRVHADSLSRRMPPFEQTQRAIQEKFGGS
jgi:glycosyltransferase involved in cell wall biosynthesis